MSTLPLRVCNDKKCKKKYGGGRWDFVRASEGGWLLQRDGTSWCPDHIPDWYGAWAAQKDLEKENKKK